MTRPSRLVARSLAVLLTAGVLAVAPATAAHAVDPIPGPQTAGDTQFPHVGNGGYDVSDYDIDIVWTPATIPGVINDQSIDATTTITAATTGAPLSSFSLDFEGLTVGTVTVNGVAAAHTRVQNAAQTRYKLIITPATPVDGAFTTVVTYSGTPVAHTDADGSKEGWNATSDGATFLNQPIGAMTGFPNNNTPQDKATYTFTLSVPSTIAGGSSAAVANGVLASPPTPIAGGRTQWVWNVAKPMASELSMISIGRYDMSASDMAVAGVGVVKEWSFVDPTTTASAGFATTRAKVKPILEFLSARYGAYPGNSTGLVVDNVTGLGINYALETQDRPFFPGSVADSTLTHELMHQWFGNNVSPEFWSDLWLSEGPATYSSAQYASESTTETAYYNQWNSTTGSTWTTPAANPSDTDPTDLYGAHVYARGAMALEALRTAVGPTDFLAIMAEWQDRHGGTSQGTEDFFALAEEISGEELTAFFQDWIYDANKPAWPGRFDLALASTPTTGSSVAPGSGVTYAVSVTNTGKVALTGAVVTLDLTDVLDDATIDGSLPANTSLAGSVLTWTVPSTALGATSNLALPVTVSAGESGSTLGATARASTLGSTCTQCSSTLSVLANPVSPSADPTIDDTTPKVGRTLTAGTAGWASGTSFTYVWKRDGSVIPGATAVAYDVVPADLGTALSVTVTGSKASFTPVSRTSSPTGPVAPGTLATPPVPKVKGTAKVGKRLTARPGAWQPGVVLTYQWFAGRKAITGATGTKLKVRKAFAGKRIRVAVTGTLPGYEPRTVRSARTAAVV